MASYTIRSAASSGIYAKLVLTEQSQSVANNTTTLLWQLYMWNTQASPNWYAYEEHNIVQISINGQYVLNTDDFGMISLQYEQTESSAKLIANGTTTIAHDSNGSKTIAASLYVEQGWYGAYKWSGSNNSISLTTIARASKPSLSVSSLTFGGSVTIYTNRASDGFMHTLTYSIGSASGTIGTAKGIGASYPWTPSKDLSKQFPNTSKGQVTITCTTYNGSTQIGDPISIQLELVVSSDMVPTISSITLTEVGQSVLSHSSVGGYIQSKSKLQYTVNVDTSTAYGATVSSYQVKINGGTYYKSSDTTGYLNTTGTNTVVATIIDSRGNPVTYDKTTFNVVAYSPPRADMVNAFRANSSGVSDEEGSYMMVEVVSTITSLGGANGRSVTVETRPSGGSWTSQEIYVSDGYAGFASWTHGGTIWADTATSYEARVRVSDSFGSSTYYTSISTASTCINIRPNKDGIAFGKMAEKAKTVQLGWDLEVEGDIKLTGDLLAPRASRLDNNDSWEGGYVTGDTHWLKLGYINCTSGYDNITLLVSSSFWGNQHGSTDLINITQDANTGTCTAHVSRTRLDNHTNRRFAYWIDQGAKRLYLFAYVNGGNGYGRWSISVLQDVIGNLWVRDYMANHPVLDWTEVPNSAINAAFAAAIANWSIHQGYAVGNYQWSKAPQGYTTIYKGTDSPFASGWYTGFTLDHALNSKYKMHLAAPLTTNRLFMAYTDCGNISAWVEFQGIESQGTSGIWNYVKYNSGLAMCWGNTGVCNADFSATWSSWYIHDYLFPAQRFPFDFVDIPQVFASQGNPGTTACDLAIYSDGKATTQYTPRYSAFRPASTASTVNLSLNLFAIGRWR